MTRAQAILETGLWNPPEHPVRVEYARAALETIRAEAVAGYCRFPRGGIEIGGILFGQIEDGAVRVLAARPVQSEYATGPSYVLSANDQAQFQSALDAAENDPDLDGMLPVGWYHSHTRTGIFLSPQDIAVQDRYFPHKRQIALVVKPEPFGTARAGFFIREADGSIRSESSYLEFVIPVKGRIRSPQEQPEEALPGPLPKAEERVEADEPEVRPFPPRPVRPAPALPDVIAPPPDPQRGAPTWFVSFMVGLVLAAIAVFTIPRFLPRSSHPRPLALRVVEDNGQLQITWDRAAVPAGQLRDASLEVTDGPEHVNLPFDGPHFREGAAAYNRRSDTVEVRLRVSRPGGQQEETVRFTGAPVDVPPPEAPGAGLQSPAASEVPVLPAQNRQTAPVTSTAARPARVFDMARLSGVQRPAGNPALPAPPAESVSVAPTVLGTAQLPVQEHKLAPPPPAPAHETKLKPVYGGPTSGRILWTGDFRQGASATMGLIGVANGELPGVPVRVSIHPAELSGRGLAVFTNSGPTRREAAGPQNGWNATTFVPDARRADELLVLELPGAQNGWKRLSVRDDARDLSVIVVDWKLAQ